MNKDHAKISLRPLLMDDEGKRASEHALNKIKTPVSGSLKILGKSTASFKGSTKI